VTRKPESFFEEMKRYVGFSDEDARLLQAVGARMDPYLAGMSERFYDQITHHPEAGKVFTGGQEQIDRLKRTLQVWAKRLFRGPFDEDYAAERYKIGVRHVLIGPPQRYMISAMGVVRTHLQKSLGEVYPSEPAQLEITQLALDKILNVDLNMMCESYFQESIRHLRELNRRLERANFELAELSHVKTEFLATTSHELRTRSIPFWGSRVSFSMACATAAMRNVNCFAMSIPAPNTCFPLITTCSWTLTKARSQAQFARFDLGHVQAVANFSRVFA